MSPRDDAEEKLVREMLLDAYREIVPEASVNADHLIRKLAHGLVARGGRIQIGPTPVPRYQDIHQSQGRDGRLVWVSKEWGAVLGYPRRTWLNVPFLDLLAPSSAKFYSDAIWPRLLRLETVGPVVLHLVTSSGVQLTSTYKSEVLKDERGAFHRTFGRLKVALVYW